MRDQVSETIYEYCKKRSDTYLLVADHGADIFKRIISELNHKFINVGIAEQLLFSASSGFTNEGLIPIAYCLSSLGITRGYDQINLDIGYANKPVLIIGDGIGFTYGQQGYTHHGLDDLALMCSVPNLNIGASLILCLA